MAKQSTPPSFASSHDGAVAVSLSLSHRPRPSSPLPFRRQQPQFRLPSLLPSSMTQSSDLLFLVLLSGGVQPSSSMDDAVDLRFFSYPDSSSLVFNRIPTISEPALPPHLNITAKPSLSLLLSPSPTRSQTSSLTALLFSRMVRRGRSSRRVFA